MATGLDVITDALKLLGIRPAESAITATEAQDGLNSLNDMMASFEGDNLFMGFVPLATVQDTVTVANEVLGAIKSQLALYIAAEYGRPVSDELFRRARRDFTSMRARLRILRPSAYPDTLPVGSGNEDRWITTDGDKPNNTSDAGFYPADVKRNF